MFILSIIEEEREASIFAMELLMPIAMFTESIKRLFPSGIMDIENESKVKTLADEYGVSKQLVLLRLQQIK